MSHTVLTLQNFQQGFWCTADFAVFPVYKLNIHVEDSDPSRPLQLSHFPTIQGSESTLVAQAIKVCDQSSDGATVAFGACILTPLIQPEK